MATRSTVSRCNYCHKELRLDSAMKQHIAATPRCKHAWEKDILASNSNTIRKPNIPDLEVPVAEAGSDDPNNWDHLQAFVPEASPEPASPAKRATHQRYVEVYPRPVGIPTGQGQSNFQVLRDIHRREDQGDHSPFASEEEWELAQWLSRRVGQKAINEYLNLSIVSAEAVT